MNFYTIFCNLFQIYNKNNETHKISVVIPTVQKNLNVLNKLIGILCEDNAVSEILIINNVNKPFTPEKQNKKIKILQTNENLYVNKSWSYGVENCVNDRILIINDDILCCKDFCTKIIRTGILEKEDTGLVGICNKYINQKPIETKTIHIPRQKIFSKISFKKLTAHLNTGDWGSAFFLKKENFYKIPEDLKIIFGDNYILYQNKKNHKKNYEICGLPFNHIHSLSSASKEFSAIIQSDIDNNYKYFTE